MTQVLDTVDLTAQLDQISACPLEEQDGIGKRGADAIRLLNTCLSAMRDEKIPLAAGMDPVPPTDWLDRAE